MISGLMKSILAQIVTENLHTVSTFYGDTGGWGKEIDEFARHA